MTEQIFISSVQREMAEERAALRDFVQRDPLLRRFFSVVLFEDLPASDRRADEVYLSEVDRCTVFVSLLGDQYGFEDAAGLSPTEQEFDRATDRNKFRLVFVKGASDTGRHPKMQALVARAGAQLVRRRFASTPELVGALYAALVQYLVEHELIRTGPFDASPCPKATLSDLAAERMATFLSNARRARGFPLPEEAPAEELLTHLSLLNDGRPTNAAVLLFGRQPQRFLISSEVKCAHFHGTRTAKPIPSYQVYKGTVFELVDQAVDFVMSKINLAIGTRAESTQAPVAYELPLEVVREAIVNAVAHRDYTSNGSVQVMLFADRLEVWNPGALPASLTLAMLRQPHGSVPGNPLLAESLYLAKYIERMGTGTEDMIARCQEARLPEPQFALTDGFVVTLWRRPGRALEAVTGEDSMEGQRKDPARAHDEAHDKAHDEAHEPMTPVERAILISCAEGPKATPDLLLALGYTTRTGNFKKAIARLLESGSLELTIPDKPRSGRQRYRLTTMGEARLDEDRGSSQ
jgi:predicted HTH transcriptional regulator